MIGFPTSEIINAKRGRRYAKGHCLHCGYKPCVCAVPKQIAARKQFGEGLPAGIRRFKRRPKDGFIA